jgi:hypothetical protein
MPKHFFETEQLLFPLNHVIDSDYRNLTEFCSRDVSVMLSAMRASDPQNTHVLNSSGYRGPEHGKVDLIAAGCSQTYGQGVQEEHTWPAMLSKMSGMSYANIAVPGTSVQTIIQSVMEYIQKHGKPKAVAVVLPSLYRFTFATRGDISIYEQHGNHDIPTVGVHDITMTPTGTIKDAVKNWPKYSRQPHDVTKVLSYEAALYLSMMSINHLIHYCKVANINLVISSWYENADEILSMKKERSWNVDFSSYVTIDKMNKLFKGSTPKVEDCHDNVDNHPYWHYGLDTAYHMGSHAHLHFAEAFYRKLK